MLKQLDPPPWSVPGLESALRALLPALRQEPLVALPRVEDVSCDSVARWMYRAALEEGAAWFPLVQLELRRVAGDARALDDAVRLARGGWLQLDGPAEPSLLSRARQQGTRVLVPGADRYLAPGPWRERLRWLDATHLVAVDPSLAELRRSLRSHCRSGSVLHLRGEPGVGKRSLVRWAHAREDDRPLTVIEGERGRPVPGQWTLFAEVDRVGPDQRHHLSRLLGERQSLSRPPVVLPGEASQAEGGAAVEGIIGGSPALAGVLERARRVADTRLSVLILGEPGAGKEHLARAVHALSGRGGPFVAIDLGALSEGLVESELFGHRKGAFTGAQRDRLGAFRSADGGTLFLDELGNLSPQVQVKLLRALQEGVIRPLGSDEEHSVDVRVVAATNADPEALVWRGLFRADLLARLDAVTLRLPPLRERPEDLLELARHFLAEARGPGGPGFSPEAELLLRAHHWPGNVRELRNVVELAAALAERGEPVRVEHLGPLAPGVRRRVPLITTSGCSDEVCVEGLDRGLASAMTAFTLTVPPLRERGPLAVRSAILASLGGRGIHLDALLAIERLPWWGNLAELRTDLEALRATTEGVVTLGTLERRLPHLLRPSGQEAFIALLGPSLDPDGQLRGFRVDREGPSLLLGRVSHLGQLRGRSARVAAWRDRVRELGGGAEPACLELSWLPQLSRAHVLITRDAEGLVAWCIAEDGLAVEAGSLEAATAPVEPGEPRALGRAGELRVLLPDRRPCLQLFVFAGAVALEEFGREAARRAGEGGWVGGTMAGQAPVDGVDEILPSRLRRRTRRVLPGLRVWPLEEAEAEALSAVLQGYVGGSFKDHVLRAVEPMRAAPRLSRLVDFLENAPRVAQYVGRLVEVPANEELRAALRQELSQEIRERLPKSVREAIRP